MNGSIALVLCLATTAGAACSLMQAAVGRSRSWPRAAAPAVAAVVAAWIAGGLLAWTMGHPPARPGVCAGYAATAAALAFVAVPNVFGRSGRAAAMSRALTLLLLAFVCWRTQRTWLTG